MAKGKKVERLHLRIDADVAREIRQHARSQSKTEVCGVLIGSESDGLTSIEACIAGENAAQGGAHVTFTQDTWEHIYKIKDRDYSEARIVGWYHSHPGFGVFLSDHDTFIHKNFFSSPQQVAWVYDPHSDEEGCFGWNGDRIRRFPKISIVDRRGGELAGGSDGREHKPSSKVNPADDGEEEPIRKRVEATRDDFSDLNDSQKNEISRLTDIVFAVFSYLAVFLLGAILSWYFWPHFVGVPVDPYTGQPLQLPDHSVKPAPQNSAPAQPGSSNSAKPQRDDAYKQ